MSGVKWPSGSLRTQQLGQNIITDKMYSLQVWTNEMQNIWYAHPHPITLGWLTSGPSPLFHDSLSPAHHLVPIILTICHPTHINCNHDAILHQTFWVIANQVDKYLFLIPELKKNNNKKQPTQSSNKGNYCFRKALFIH